MFWTVQQDKEFLRAYNPVLLLWISLSVSWQGPGEYNRGPRHPSDNVQIYSAEAEFLDVIGTKVLWVFLLAIHSHLC